MSEKRKRNVVTIEQKLNALERLDKGESVKRICDELNVGKSTVNDWRKNRKSIQDFCTQVESGKTLSTRCTLRKPTNELVDDAVWLWFQQERRRGTPLSGPIIKEKARLLHSKIEAGGEFSASDGWLTRWKKRHGVHFIGVCGEKLSADKEAASETPAKFQDYYVKERGLHPEQVYNMDETGLNFKMLPQKTLATSQEKSAPGFKTNKERLTVAVCSNASGTHKIPLMVIGKAVKPRAFKNVNVSSLPVYYRAQKSAWMETYLFKEWFVTEFVPQVKKHLSSLKMPIKAVLVIDNAPTHPEELQCEEEKDITLYYLPAHVTSVLQPMDQGVIASLKRRYRHKLLSEILSKLDGEDTGLISALKTINIKDVIYMLAKAYEEMPNTTFVKSWRKLWPRVEEAIDQNQEDNPVPVQNMTETIEPDDDSLLNDMQNLPGCATLTAEDVNDWVTADQDLENEFLCDDEIVNAVVTEDVSENEEEEGDVDGENVEEISHAEAKDALEFITSYIERQKESTPADIMFVKKWRDFAFKRAMDSKKQKKIEDYFKT